MVFGSNITRAQSSNDNVLPSITMAAYLDGTLINSTLSLSNAIKGPAKNFRLSVSSFDSDGTVEKLEILNGAFVDFTLNTVRSTESFFYAELRGDRTYEFIAKVTDNKGGVTYSSPIRFTVYTPPAVSISSPLNNSSIVGPAIIPLSVEIGNFFGSVSKVSYYSGKDFIAESGSFPYIINFYKFPVGKHTITAKVLDNYGGITETAPITFTVIENKPPIVSLTTAKQDTVISGTNYNNITLTAVASDPDGSVVKVDFYSGQVLVGSSTTSPFTCKWIKVSSGAYTLTAKATDNTGAVTVSNSIIVVVNNNKLPVVSIKSPANNTIFYENVGGTVVVNASDADGTINNVELYNGTTLITSSTFGYQEASGIYIYNLSFSVAPGTYVVTAKAKDNNGGVSVSSPVTIEVYPNKRPTVSIKSPENNSVYYEPATITLEALADDADGNISRVYFYNDTDGGKIIGGATAPPYTFTWKDVKAGKYIISATAIDDKGSYSYGSEKMTITVIIPQAPFGGNPWPIPGLVEAENYDLGGNNVGYYDSYRMGRNEYGRGDLVDVEGHGSYNGSGYEGYHISYIEKGEWLKYTVNVLNTGIYDFAINGCTFTPNPPRERYMHIEINDVDVTGPILVPYTTGWFDFKKAKVPGIYLTEGIQIMKVVFDSSELNLDYVEITPSDVVTGLTSHSSGNSLSIYPNPAPDFFNLKVNEDIRSLSVLNLLGQNVHAEANLTKGSELSIGNEFERGAYVLNVIYASGDRESFRLIKVR